ncbi:CDGSH iron-sulfur domain-containing protein [Streptomyces sp. SYP-A7185]|uniref:CDGSH iron-sulfur domain-containing protein n=1 Tax=Streptomyces sp. SYP-A7185 TaxID=3040076 RepID=UPI0038F6B560
MPNAPEPEPAARDPRPRRVTIDPEGPLLVEGPVEVVKDDGTVVASRRFTAAICTCRRSRTYPWCDTSHRRRVKAEDATPSAAAGSDTENDEHTKGEEAPDDHQEHRARREHSEHSERSEHRDRRES